MDYYDLPSSHFETSVWCSSCQGYKVTILSVFYKDKKGGFNKRLYMLYKGLAGAGHHVFYLSTETLSVHHQNISPVIVDVRFRGTYLFWFCFIIKSLTRCLSLVRENKIDLIVTFGPFYTLLCALPIIFYKTPTVTFIRADNMKQSTNSLRNGFFYLADWLGIELSRKILVVSNALKQTYQRRYKIADKKIEIQPNNIEKIYTISDDEKVEIRKSLGTGQYEFLITTSGVFNEGKNFSFLIQAMQYVNQQKIKLAIIGDEVVPTGERKRLEELVTEFGLWNRVVFYGWQKDPARFIASSDMYIYPSKYEGSPNALLEALGCSVPCLGSKIEEIEEILRFDELLFPLDDEKGLAQKILRAADDPAYCKYLKGLSLQCREKYSFEWGSETIKAMMDL